MDSDDQNCSNKIKFDIENNLIEDDYKTDIDGNCGIDGNGNRIDAKEEIIDCNCISEDNHLDEKIMRKLQQAQAMSISDDDYGKTCENFLELLCYFKLFVYIVLL